MSTAATQKLFADAPSPDALSPRRSAEREVFGELVEEMRSLKMDSRHDGWDAPGSIFRRLRLHMSRVDPNHAEELLGAMQPKVRVLRFVIDIHDERAIYRKQAAELLVTFLRMPTWMDALDRDVALQTSLPDDVWVALGNGAIPAMPALTVVEVPASPFVASPRMSLSLASEAGCSIVLQGLWGEDADGSARAGAAGGAPRRSTARKDTATTLEALELGRDRMDALSFHAGDVVLAGAAFDVFFSAVMRITQLANEYHHTHLEALEPKEDIMLFLSEFSMLHLEQEQRVNQVMRELLVFDSWRQAANVASAPPAPTAVADPLKSSKVEIHRPHELFGFRRKMRELFGKRHGCL